MAPDHPVYWDDRSILRRVEHEVVLRAKELRWLCRPVDIPKPGLPWDEAAKLLGTDACTIRLAIRRGVFAVHRVQGLGGKRGPPVPIVYTPELLDPGSDPLGKVPDVEWGARWRYLSEHIPDDVNQVVRRRPVYQCRRGNLCFKGWRWVCPGCGRETFRIFYPLAAPALPPFFPKEPPGSPDQIETPLPCFACKRCHRIQEITRFGGQSWSILVAHLSGGLLYASEVQKPAWYAFRRQVPYHPRPRRTVSPLKGRILRMLLTTDMSHKEMAIALRMTIRMVQARCYQLCRQYGVHSRDELRAKLPPHKIKPRRRRHALATPHTPRKQAPIARKPDGLKLRIAHPPRPRLVPAPNGLEIGSAELVDATARRS